jgi:HlyD family secretion protein
MDGIVSSMSVKKGERVVGTAQMAGTEMMRVADMKSIEVRVDVGENDITKVKIGDTALVEVDAYNNRKFKGIVYKIANPVTAASAVATSTEVANYKVHIRLEPSSYEDLIKENSKFPFRPGMTASADIQTKSKVNAISIPLNAVTTRDKEGNGKDTKVSTKTEDKGNASTANKEEELNEVVFVLQKDNKVKMVNVKTAIQDLNYIEVSGLKVGDEVITGPYSTVSKILKDGSLVKIVTKDKLFEEKK